jgi:hypothetical protein
MCELPENGQFEFRRRPNWSLSLQGVSVGFDEKRLTGAVFLEMAKAFDTAMVAYLVSVILVTIGTELGAVKQTGRLLSTFICSAVAGSVNQ